jgi:hypothetical protein
MKVFANLNVGGEAGVEEAPGKVVRRIDSETRSPLSALKAIRLLDAIDGDVVRELKQGKSRLATGGREVEEATVGEVAVELEGYIVFKQLAIASRTIVVGHIGK